MHSCVVGVAKCYQLVMMVVTTLVVIVSHNLYRVSFVRALKPFFRRVVGPRQKNWRFDINLCHEQ